MDTSTPPVEVNYRMAFVGTVAFADADGEMLASRKYAATQENGPSKIFHAMMQDVRHALRQDASLRIVVVQDAAKEMWTLLTGTLPSYSSARSPAATGPCTASRWRTS